MASTASGIEYPVAGDFIAPLNAHLQALAETTQEALDERASTEPVSYTPTFTGLTVGNGVVSASYAKAGALIVDQIVVTFGSTTAVTGDVAVAGLQPSASNVSSLISGNVLLHDNGTAFFAGVAIMSSTTSLRIQVQRPAGIYISLSNLSSTVPHTWAVGDRIVINIIRLAA
jgi:hypothetical protein